MQISARVISLTILAFTCSSAAQEFHPDIPRVWDDNALKTFEVPLAQRDRSPRYMEGGVTAQMVEGIKAPDDVLPRGFVLSNTIAALLVEAASIFFILLETFLRGLGRARPGSDQDMLQSIFILTIFSAAVSLPWVCLAVWRWIRHGTPERSMEQIGRTVLESLNYAGEIDTHSGDFRVHAERHDQGSVVCWLGGGTRLDQHKFLEAIRQLLRPVDNPRFLLARSGFWRGIHEDFFSVPRPGKLVRVGGVGCGEGEDDGDDPCLSAE